jgi:hypothetical protein
VVNGDLEVWGTSYHHGLEVFAGGISIPLTNGGTIVINPDGGFEVRDPAGNPVGGIDGDGNITGTSLITTGPSHHSGPETFDLEGGGEVEIGGNGITIRDEVGNIVGFIGNGGELETKGPSDHHGTETFHQPDGSTVTIGPDGIVIRDAAGNITGTWSTDGSSHHYGVERFHNGPLGGGWVDIGPGGITVVGPDGLVKASIDNLGNLTTEGSSTHNGPETFNGGISVPMAGGGVIMIGPGGIVMNGPGGMTRIEPNGNISTSGKINAAGGVDPIMLESFKVVPGYSYEQGDVMVIDPDGSGYRPSYKEYDSGIVGVVSDPTIDVAGELLGVVMGAAGPSPAAGIPGERMEVYVKVDATYGPIKPGDLLTTSSTPAHAMKASNPQIGTILGKALEPLASGQGMIKVFVMLQ